MSRLLRNTDPQAIRLITIRTAGMKFWLRPDQLLNEVLGGIIARYQEKYEIDIFAYCVLRNHYHLVVRAPKQNLWCFEQEISREIAKRVNQLRKREGSLWARRYDDQIAVEAADALEAVLYVVCNPVSHGLVRHSRSWPGLNSLKQFLGGSDHGYYFTDFSAFHKAQAVDPTVTILDFEKKYQLQVSRLPRFLKGLMRKNLPPTCIVSSRCA